MMPVKKALLFVSVLLLSGLAKSQISADKLKQFLSNPAVSSYGLSYTKQVKEFYSGNNYACTWLTKTTNGPLPILVSFIQRSPGLGLWQEDYQPVLFSTHSPLSPQNEQDSLLAEIKYTDAAIHLLHDVLMGNQPETTGYNGLNYLPSCYDIPALLNTYLATGRFASLLEELEPKDAEYRSVKQMLRFFQQTNSAVGFKDAIVTATRTNNQSLLARLTQLGILRPETISVTEQGIKSEIKEAQELFGLESDGIAGRATLAALNIPLAARVTELAHTLNTLRWLSCIKQNDHVVIVNIPSATLLVYERGKVVLSSRIIVGKPATPTPTLNSEITEVILYPYWTVPYKIATRELLPSFKRSRAYFDQNNFQVLNNAGRVINPSSVNWHSLSPYYFPYTIRQSTGCDNSLGLIKLNFYNPFSVYLHDTPSKVLFGLAKRFFSHGCMRVQKANEVARYILKNKSSIIDTLEEKGCPKDQQPITIKSSEKIPVFVLYRTAWVDSTAQTHFYEDIYNRFPYLHKK